MNMGYIRYENIVNKFNPELINKFKEAKMRFDNIKNKNDANNKKEKKMSQEIIILPIEELGDFPKQNEIYGEPIIEAEFIASIKECGIITPLIVSQSSDAAPTSEKPYIIISGHRRRYGAIEAGLDKVPCVVHYYNTPDEAELEFLTCNMQREKSDRVRLKEFLHYKQLLCQLGKVRKKSRNYENTIFVNKYLIEILDKSRNGENLSDLSLDSTEILKKITGYTEYEQTYLSVLYDGDWLQRQLDKLRVLGCQIDVEEQLLEQFSIAVAGYEAETCTLNNAVSEIKRIFKEVENNLKPKEKPLKTEKKKIVKREVIEIPMFLGVSAEVQIKKMYSEKPIKFSPEGATAEFFFKSEGISFGVMRNMGHPTAFCIDTQDGVVIINSEKIVELFKNL